MSLKFVVETLDGVPETARGFYVEREGKFVLDAEGAVPKGRLDEFRDNNLALTRQISDLQKRYEGIDPDQARALSERARHERDRKLIDAGRVDELVSERTATLRAEFAGIASERERLKKELAAHVVDGAIRDAASRAGVRAAAIEDVLARGRALFRLEGGKAIALDGDKPVYGRDGEPLGVGEWISGLSAQAPHLFEASRGGGAPGGAGSRAAMGMIDRNDTAGFLAHVDDIAAGRLKVS